MTHRERVFAAIDHTEVDRPPMDFVCEPWMRDKIADYLGVGGFESALTKLDIDFRQLSFKEFLPKPVPDETGTYTDIWGVRRKPVINQFGSYDEVDFRPFAEMTDLKQVEDFSWPTPDVFDFSNLETVCRSYHDDYAVIWGGPAVMDLINGTAYGRGYEALLMDIAVEDPVGLALMERRHRFFLEGAERALKTANGLIDILWCGDDYGSQIGPLFSVEMWRARFAPKLRAFIDLGHRYGAKVMLHSCGSNRRLLPEWINMGLDIYQTVQVEAVEMEPEGLFKDFGKDITFHGMLGVQSVLPHGTPDDVRKTVREIFDLGGRTGWIAAPSHNFQPDTPLENVCALYDWESVKCKV